MPQASFQCQYYRRRLCGGEAELDALAAVMGRDGAYAPASAWFQRWDEVAESRALQLEREMGLVTSHTARPEFLNEAMRRLVRELERGPAAPRPVAALAPALAAAV